MTRKILLLATLAVASMAALGAAIHAANPRAPENFREASIQLPNADMLDAAARPFALRDDIEQDAIVVINFSYTTCDSICPLGNQILQFVDDRRHEVTRPVHLLTITIDPASDTPDKMRRTAEAFGASENWHWLTSSPAVIADILEAADADVTDIELHDPVFLVGEMETGRYFRSLSMPDADEILAMLGHFDA
ncbi:SCO family protein [Roseovarius sp. SCSIO 43702]|uniref:SCO family protein n=1 Tax=Roseovarius sp. SCSIO 43702 TaxID=2823043 RepID=UPI001C733D42|nr:SCO family protein [Roseovarius sp. SCSIO 43702]QYX56323.1 SCO family protein [Roseovarius sp. SCSIO 43702]